MSIRINTYTAAKGAKLQVSEPTYATLDSDTTQDRDPIQVECRLGEMLFEHTGLEKSAFDTLIVAASLPRLHSALLGATLARILDVSIGRVVEFSGGCGSVIDAIHYAFGCAKPSEHIAIMVIDSFSTSYSASSAGCQWTDGGGLIEIKPRGHIGLTLEAYATAFDPSHLEMAHPLGGEIRPPFSPAPTRGFHATDKYAIMAVIEGALNEANIDHLEVTALITVNRTKKSLEWISAWLGPQCYFAHSRDSISHSGGADIMANLRDALNRVSDGYICLLGTGLGYTWQAMLLRVSRQ